MIKNSKKLDVVRCMLTNKSIRYILDGMDFADLVELRGFLWEKTLEFGVLNRGADFTKAELARHVKPLRDKDKLKDIKVEEAKYQIESICQVARETI